MIVFRYYRKYCRPIFWCSSIFIIGIILGPYGTGLDRLIPFPGQDVLLEPDLQKLRFRDFINFSFHALCFFCDYSVFLFQTFKVTHLRGGFLLKKAKDKNEAHRPVRLIRILRM